MRVFSEGDDLYRLEDGTGAHVGTIRGRTISFRGLPTEDAARDAAVAAWWALNDALRREYPSWPHHELALDRIGTVHDGAYEWFYDGARAIARLVRPLPGRREHAFGIELLLPSYASDGVAITASHGMSRAIEPYRESTSNEPPDVELRTTQPYAAAALIEAPSSA